MEILGVSQIKEHLIKLWEKVGRGRTPVIPHVIDQGVTSIGNMPVISLEQGAFRKMGKRMWVDLYGRPVTDPNRIALLDPTLKMV